MSCENRLLMKILTRMMILLMSMKKNLRLNSFSIRIWMILNNLKKKRKKVCYMILMIYYFLHCFVLQEPSIEDYCRNVLQSY
jgi:succinate dehydrogenase hydrophobic anchor subunit